MKSTRHAFVLVAMLLLLFSSCKKETVDVTELLITVPSSASGVIVFNVEDMLEKAGCKIKDHSVIPGKEMSAYFEKQSSQDAEDIKMIFAGDAGIEPKAAVWFYDSNRMFLTFALYDPAKYISFVEKKTGSKFTDEVSGVKINGNVAVRGSQAWIVMSGKRPDADAIASYAELKDSQSFLVTPMGEKLLTEEDDVRGWAMLNNFTKNLLSRDSSGLATMGINFLFEDPESVKFKLDFDKGEMEAEAVVLNEKYKPAKYKLPAEKVDVKTLKTLGSTCDAMMAFTVNNKLIKKLAEVTSLFGGFGFGDLEEVLNNLNGTIGVTTSGTGLTDNVNGVLTTKGELSKTLTDLISSQLSPVSRDGNLLRFEKGDVKGNLTVDECAEELKGSCIGIISDGQGIDNMFYGQKMPDIVRWVSFKMSPESGGLEMELKIKTTEPKENFLFTLVRNSN